MADSNLPSLTLEQAKHLVSLLEEGEEAKAQQLLSTSHPAFSSDLFSEVGKLTRQLHDALQDFQLDPRLGKLATDDIPDATQRLNYVLEKTEDAANRTMDAVDASLPIADRMHSELAKLMPSWKSLMERQIERGQFKELCHSLNDFLESAEKDSDVLRERLTEVLMAQDFQDLTGQVIRRVIELVTEVEDNLIHLLKVFGAPEKVEETSASQIEAEGPIVDAAEREDVVNDQDDVDDLLSSLGF
ncbi:protein phosphatase CheZ [Corallincola luteus]|uniref:Protein phosphatase CheZ n=2 Tax=Corallincola TaxID=1775176 RepID=A0A368N3B6_9GAMM|nr:MULTISPECIES: protein phosphatase CheZ [Corallincola]RCU44553.1 protein phosphatase CheZ [Corallincola holothuriorum]TCI05395.1 protein phosphatase CheZ [Corallincola luteus]